MKVKPVTDGHRVSGSPWVMGILLSQPKEITYFHNGATNSKYPICYG